MSWLEQRFDRGRTLFEALARTAGDDAERVWLRLADRDAFPDSHVAEALSAAIVAGGHSRRFPRLVQRLTAGMNDELDGEMPRLPALRLLLLAVATALAHTELLDLPEVER